MIPRTFGIALAGLAFLLFACPCARATPSNRRAFSEFFGPCLSRRLDGCNTCHLPLRAGLKPRPPASREVLLRRVYLDLIGLNPTPEEIRAFLADRSPDAYEKVVDRLLADRRYGERWARHWMDVWRYSDWAGWADGNQIRDSKPHIWRWRDWIIESLNNDKGYDRMVLEMVAGDEVAPEDPEILRATGFLARNFKLL